MAEKPNKRPPSKKNQASNKAQKDVSKRVSRVSNALNQKFTLVEKTEIKGWHFLVATGLIAGLIIGVIVVTELGPGGAESAEVGPISLRSITSNANKSDNKLTLSRPSDVQKDDILVASLSTKGSPDVKPPSSWTLIRSDRHKDKIKQVTYYKVADSNEPSSYEWRFSSDASAAGGVYAYDGVDPSDPVNVHDANVVTSKKTKTISTPSIATSVENTRIHKFLSTDTNTEFSSTDSMDDRWNTTSRGKGKITHNGADVPQAEEGDTGQKTSKTKRFGSAGIAQIVALSPEPDTTPPDVVIMSPDDGDVVSGTITVEAGALDNVGVEKVEFFVDDVKEATDSSSPYTFSWDTTSVSDGGYDLTAKAYDTSGNTALSDPVTVTVDNSGDSTDDSTTTTSDSDDSPTLSVSISADPNSGVAPLEGVDLTAEVSGSAEGDITYTFYCDRSDSGTDITSGWDHQVSGTQENPLTVVDLCSYEEAGTSTPKVIAEREDLAAEARTEVVVDTLSTSDTGEGIFISQEEISELPTSGDAWDFVKSTADSDWGTADLSDQNNKHPVKTLSGALVYARLDDSSYREKVRSAVMSAIGTEDGGKVLSLARGLGAYVIAADLIDLENLSPSDDDTFRQWLDEVRTKHIGNHGRWVELTQTHENSANNWGTFAGASRIAASLYIGDTDDVDRAAQIFKAWLGDRSAYPPDAPGQDGYFEPTAAFDDSWACDPDNWVAVNPSCTKDGVSIDGGLVEELSRGGSFTWPPESKSMSYSWEALQGVYVQAEMLNRAGYDAYSWSDLALRRSMNFMENAGWDITNPAKYVPWMANARYDESYPTTDSGFGRIMGYGDWLYGN